MKIQNVLGKNEESEKKEQILLRHQEILSELKKQKEEKQKINELENNDVDSSNKEDSYSEMVQRIKAAGIVSRITRGEEVGESERNFLNQRYPQLLSEARAVLSSIEKVSDKVDKVATKEEAEKIIQETNKNLLDMPYGEDKETVFTHLVKKANKKK